jgi:hypothetical protein
MKISLYGKFNRIKNLENLRPIKYWLEDKRGNKIIYSYSHKGIPANIKIIDKKYGIDIFKIEKEQQYSITINDILEIYRMRKKELKWSR